MFNADSRLARASGVEKDSVICLRHRNEANKVDNRWSFPLVTPELTHTSSLLHLPERLHEAMDNLGGKTSACYRPGTKWCTNYRKTGERILRDRVLEQCKAPTKREVHLWYCHAYLRECKSKIASCLLPLSP